MVPRPRTTTGDVAARAVNVLTASATADGGGRSSWKTSPACRMTSGCSRSACSTRLASTAWVSARRSCRPRRYPRCQSAVCRRAVLSVAAPRRESPRPRRGPTRPRRRRAARDAGPPPRSRPPSRRQAGDGAGAGSYPGSSPAPAVRSLGRRSKSCSSSASGAGFPPVATALGGFSCGSCRRSRRSPSAPISSPRQGGIRDDVLRVRFSRAGFSVGGLPRPRVPRGHCAPPIGAPVLPRFHMCGARRPAFQHFLRGWIPPSAVPGAAVFRHRQSALPRSACRRFSSSFDPLLLDSARRRRGLERIEPLRRRGSREPRDASAFCPRILLLSRPCRARLDTASRSLGPPLRRDAGQRRLDHILHGPHVAYADARVVLREGAKILR